MEILFFAAILGLIPAVIAQHKGRSFVGFWIYGALLFIVALPHALLMKPDVAALEQRQIEEGSGRKCPFCAEVIKAEARVCRYCARDVEPVPVRRGQFIPPPTDRAVPLLTRGLQRELRAQREDERIEPKI